MGSCFSRSQPDDPRPVAKVISVYGELHEYPVPVTVSRVLHYEGAGAPPPLTSSSTGLFFVCDSDALYYEERIPALDPSYELVSDQIYFVLPESRINCRVRGAEMAALAVKASLALQKAEEKRRRGGVRRRRKSFVQISPVVDARDGGGYNEVVTNDGYGGAGVTVRGRSVSNSRVARPGSYRKASRVSSYKRGKIAVGSSRVRLSTIYEET